MVRMFLLLELYQYLPLSAVGDVVCRYSEKCPERGSASSEKFAGGLGEEVKTSMGYMLMLFL